MSRELSGLVKDNEADIGPALEHVHGVLEVLDAHQSELRDIVQGLYVFVRGEVDATGSGPWFDGSAINVINPFEVDPVPGPPADPETLGELLGVPQLSRSLTTGSPR
jgi:phospholipid/cholesterol/gamma-HCH transport system substrate-binding protein